MKILMISLHLLLSLHQSWSACRNEDHFGIYFVFCDNITAFEDIPKNLYSSPKFYIFISNSKLSLTETTPLDGLQKLEITSSVITHIKSEFFGIAPSLGSFKIENCRIDALESFPAHNISDLKVYNNTIENVPVDLLHNLLNLQVFAAERNTFVKSKIIPGYFFKNLVLVYLSLENSKLSSLDQNSLRSLHELVVLTLADNDFEELPDNLYKDLQHVVEVNLNHNKITKFTENSFNGLNSVKTLKISGNKLSAVEQNWFEKLHSLNTLDLSHNNIKEFHFFMRNLTTLFLSYNNLDIINDDAFKGLSSLNSLDLSYNSIKTISPEAFNGLVKLRHINLEHNKIQRLDRDLLKYLTSLNVLIVSSNDFQSLDAIQFDDLKNLTHLNASFNNLKELKSDFSKVPHLKNLDLANTSLVHLEAPMFRNLKELEVLNISDNNIKTLLPRVFSNLINLQKLYLVHVGLTELDNDTFSKLGNLIDLDLEGNLLNELPLSVFDDFMLQSLSIKGNPIQQISEDIYKKQNKLETINLENTLITSVNETDVIPNLKYLMLTGTVFEKNVVFRTKNRRFEKINDRYWDSWCPEYFLPCQSDDPVL